MDIDGVEGLLVDHGILHHHHPGDPEEDDVETGDQHGGWEVFFKLGGLLGPAQRADGPEARGEPGVEHVGVAAQGFAGGHGLRRCLGRRAILIALIVEPNRDLMPPPQLARDAPWLDVLQPVEIHFAVLFRQDRDFTRTHSINSGLHDLVGCDEPLVGQHWLDHHLGAVAEGLHDLLGFDERHEVLFLGAHLAAFAGLDGGLFGGTAKARVGRLGHHGKALGGHVLHHALAGLETIQAAVGVRHEVDLGRVFGRGFGTIGDGLSAGGCLIVGQTIGAHPALGVHQRVERDIVALGHTVVVEVMRAGDLHRTRAEVLVRVFVGDDRDRAALLFRANGNFAEFPDN